MFTRAIVLSLFLQFSVSASAGDYCLALRGNGELMPAHWGAVSNVVEKLGLPAAQAGGSSATITMFLLDAVASNPLVKGSNPDVRAARASLMIKSFQGFAEFLEESNQYKDFRTLYGKIDDFQKTSWIDLLSQVFEKTDGLPIDGLVEYIRNNSDLIKRNVQVGEDLGLIGPDNYRSLYLALRFIYEKPVSYETIVSIHRAKFYLNELKHSVKAFGSYDAASDANLLFRPGIINFDRLAEQVGRIGQFYAASGVSPDILLNWEKWVGLCTQPARGKTWSAFTALRGDCAAEFRSLILSYFKAQPENAFVQSLSGQEIPSFSTVAVLTGRAYEQGAQLMIEYENNLNPNFGKGLAFSQPEEIKFGYWGWQDRLKKAELNLPQDDEKSRRFLNLGQASWFQVLRLSPAEPGLASMRPFKLSGQDLISAGGWSDLHPSTLLKAAGCERVVYVTRRGGEASFAQGVANKFFGFSEPMNQDPLWSKLYNLGNPRSSYRTALDQSDAILCTDWNRYNVKHGLLDLVEDAYRSPFFVRSDKELEVLLRPKLSPEPQYEGCF